VTTATTAEAHPSAPPLPPGGFLELPGRGRTFVRDTGGGPGAPVLLLLHGWTATADLNWCTSYRSLARHFRVVALDLRGHGRGIRSRRPFRMRDCADDAAAVLDALGVDRAIAVGYSMGGPVAQLFWRRHPDRATGLVLCATSRTFAGSRQEQAMFGALGGLSLAARAMPPVLRRRIAREILGRRLDDPSFRGWALSELRRNDPVAVLEAGRAIGRFDSRRWAAEIDVPTAVVVTTQDTLVHPSRQLALARTIPDASVHLVEGDHTACVADARLFVPVLVEACQSVAARSARRV